MRRLRRERRQGIQQHPHNVKIAANSAKEIITDDTKTLYFPNTSSQESHIEASTPECSFILPFKDLKPSMALVRLPSAAVLLGMNVQHCSPKMAQTPPFSANNRSKAILFWNVRWPGGAKHF
ncbi:hypothetical protein ATANTOWER_030667 [Ataeniobius toweri]|uniref:Uncharacterized protein n=1 Tax=Ataeniobius toweri TaxID=208326 RepID=A0ABU7CA58_9TELE|nr:hypothetical protein [Ataeniobius toweri]